MSSSVREMKESDIKFVVDYFVDADPEYLRGMGADKNKLPNRTDWITKLKEDLNKPIKEKEFYYIIWQIKYYQCRLLDNVNIEYGKNATMHLHIWKSEKRRSGNGLDFLKKTIPFYFENFKVEKLICEPYALNHAPTKVLEKVGFEFIKEYDTTPGWISFFQPVKRYEMSRDRFNEIFPVNTVEST